MTIKFDYPIFCLKKNKNDKDVERAVSVILQDYNAYLGVQTKFRVIFDNSKTASVKCENNIVILWLDLAVACKSSFICLATLLAHEFSHIINKDNMYMSLRSKKEKFLHILAETRADLFAKELVLAVYGYYDDSVLLLNLNKSNKYYQDNGYLPYNLRTNLFVKFSKYDNSVLLYLFELLPTLYLNYSYFIFIKDIENSVYNIEKQNWVKNLLLNTI